MNDPIIYKWIVIYNGMFYLSGYSIDGAPVWAFNNVRQAMKFTEDEARAEARKWARRLDVECEARALTPSGEVDRYK